ncbi:UNVERIFIED_CONTAM: hypothetical protein Slati_3943400 [Sesamum latifolium]|uniref:Uncharacterized protein n=1 Tax=Sesamum latifolium TaxID=2727402 RepID=A0AAW2TN63_9LAMI
MSLEDIVKSLALTPQQLQQDSTETKASLQHIGNQIYQLAMRIEKLAIQASQEQPSQTDTHQLENVGMMTLRGEKELHIIEQAPIEAKGDEMTLNNTDTQNVKVESDLIPPPLSNTFALPFPCRIPKSKDDEKEILNTSLKGLFKEQYQLKLNKKEDLRNCKLGSSWLGRFESVNIFPHGVARLKSLDMGRIFKVNGHRSKPSLGGDEVTTIIGIALASLQQLTH